MEDTHLLIEQHDKTAPNVKKTKKRKKKEEDARGKLETPGHMASEDFVKEKKKSKKGKNKNKKSENNNNLADAVDENNQDNTSKKKKRKVCQEGVSSSAAQYQRAQEAAAAGEAAAQHQRAQEAAAAWEAAAQHQRAQEAAAWEAAAQHQRAQEAAAAWEAAAQHQSAKDAAAAAGKAAAAGQNKNNNNNLPDNNQDNNLPDYNQDKRKVQEEDVSSSAAQHQQRSPLVKRNWEGPIANRDALEFASKYPHIGRGIANGSARPFLNPSAANLVYSMMKKYNDSDYFNFSLSKFEERAMELAQEEHSLCLKRLAVTHEVVSVLTSIFGHAVGWPAQE